MTKEICIPKNEVEPLAGMLSATFIQRHDLYARQLNDGSYICIRKPLSPGHVMAHLAGDLTLGGYALDQNSLAKFIVFDADDLPQFTGLLAMMRNLVEQAVISYCEVSRRGGHLWLFLPKPVDGKSARLFGKNLLRQHQLHGIELFPKQDRLSDGPGSLIRLPFGVHRKTGKRYGFITEERKPLAPTLQEQIRILGAPVKVPEAFMNDLLVRTPPEPQAPVLLSVGDPKTPLSERIKNSVSVYDFISRYIELSPAGRGLCPFHDDHALSFSVNAEKNYWHCFAGCGGGSVIDFWMRYRNCDFCSAVRELAEVLFAFKPSRYGDHS
ncbi:MAG TPA: CHC2 zinc finger domain-containing protein [Anaerolineaceae bacterium]